MSDILVTVNDNTPQVTVTNNDTLSVSIIQASPVSVIPVDSQPKVIINTGVGGAYDISTLLRMLADRLSLSEMNPELAASLQQLSDLWARVDTQADILTSADETSIRQAITD